MIAGKTDKQSLLNWAALLGIFFLGMALRLHELDGDSLWYDEIFTSVVAQRDLSSAIEIVASGEGATSANQVPLMYVVTHFFILLFGDSDFIVRVQAMLFASLSILLAYRLGEILWTRKEGLVGALLLAVNTYHVEYSQEARHYALMVFLALLSLIFLIEALQKRSAKGLWIGFALCTSLSLYNHYFAFLFLPAVVVFGTVAVVEQRRAPRRLDDQRSDVHGGGAAYGSARQALMFSGSLALVAVTYMPWLPALQLAITEQQVAVPVTSVSTRGLRSSLHFLGSLPTEYTAGDGVTLLLWLGLFLLGLVQSGGRRALLAASWVAIPLAFPLLVTAQHGFNPRYLIFVVPVYLLTVAHGVVFGAHWLAARLRGAVAHGHRLSPLVLTLAALVLAVLNGAPLRDYYRGQKQDYRGAAQYLRDNMGPNDIILADSLNPHRGGANQVRVSLTYYLDSHGITQAPIFPVERGLWPALRDSEYHNGQAWAVLFYPRTLIPTEEVEVVEFYHVPLIRLVQPSGDVLHDTICLLQALPELLNRPDACVDVYLALAEAHLNTGEYEQAAAQLYQAGLVLPDDPAVARDLADLRSELAQRSHLVDSDIRYPLWGNLGELIAFIGYDMDQTSVQTRDSLRVTVWWQALAEMERDYSVFIHVVGPDDHIWAQTDTLLQNGDHSTSSWLPGETARQEYELELPSDMPPAEYVIKTGVYYWKTGDRLALWDEEGKRMAEDSLLLGAVRVRE